MNYTILIADDEPEIRTLLRLYLENENYQIIEAENGKQALELLKKEHVDLCLLDIMMPEMDGYHVLQELRKTSNIPVMILSAKDADSEKILGLNLGADDYLAKPFNLSELNARLKSVLRRRNFGGQKEFKYNEIRILPDLHAVFVNENEIEFTRKEYDLLTYLIINRERVLTKEAIVEHLWGDYMGIGTDTFDALYTHMRKLRKKLQDAGAEDYIETIYAVGYKFTLKEK